jgi:orotate phosphoribosyltransferase
VLSVVEAMLRLCGWPANDGCPELPLASNRGRPRIVRESCAAESRESCLSRISGYALEYGDDALELRAGTLSAGARVLLVDDVLATGGTLAAARSLLLAAGLQPVAALVLIDLVALEGRARLGSELDVRSILSL